MKKEIFALGVGHGTPIFIELAEACGYEVVGLYHYDGSRTGEVDHGFEILGSFEDLYRSDVRGKSFVLTMGDMRIKEEVSERLKALGGILPTLVHPTAIISRFAKISDSGVLICSQSEIHSDSIIEEGCVLWPCAMIDHDSRVHRYVFFGPKSYVGAYTEVGEKAFIGQCSVLISGKAKSIGANALVGAGALVTKPVEANTIVAGHPAKVVGGK